MHPCYPINTPIPVRQSAIDIPAEQFASLVDDGSWREETKVS